MDKRMSNYEERKRAAAAWLREHHAGAAPDAGFAARVAVRLEDRSSWLLGWTAMRMLPVALASVLLLAAVAWKQDVDATVESVAAVSSGTTATDTATDTAAVGDEPDEEFVSPSEDLLTWVLDDPTRETP